MKDLMYKPSIRIFFLFEESDNFYFDLFIQIFNSDKVICVNDDTEIQDELARSGKIIDKVDYFVTLVSQSLLKSYDLLKILINNYEKSKRFIMLIIDKFLYNSDNRKTIYDNWENKIETLTNDGIRNKDTNTILESLQEANVLLPKELESLCSAMKTVTNKLEFLAKKLCNAIKSNSKTNDFLKYEGKKLTNFLNKKIKELQGGNAMNNQPPQQIVYQTINNNNGNGTFNNATGHNNTLKSTNTAATTTTNNDLDSIRDVVTTLIKDIRNESSGLDNNQYSRIICALDDIEEAIKGKTITNTGRFSNAINNIDSLLSIVSNTSTLFNLMQSLLTNLSPFIP